MLTFGGKKVYLACGVTDMRKSINGLSAIVESSFKLNPFDEAVEISSKTKLCVLQQESGPFKNIGVGRRWVLAVFQEIGERTFSLGGSISIFD